jgi:hypothetical protein
MRVAAITMVHNEAFFLPLWYRYYGSQLGPDNLYVIDHGSTDGSVSETFGNRIRIARDKFDDVSRAVMVSDLHRALLRFYDTVIYTDVDEFIVPRPRKYAGLAQYAERRKIAIPQCCGVNVVPLPSDPEIDTQFPILRQRPNAFPTHWYCKPLLASQPMVWDAGFHNCVDQSEIDPDLWLFHMKQIKPGHEQPSFMSELYGAGDQGSLVRVDFEKVVQHRQGLWIHSVPQEFQNLV